MRWPATKPAQLVLRALGASPTAGDLADGIGSGTTATRLTGGRATRHADPAAGTRRRPATVAHREFQTPLPAPAHRGAHRAAGPATADSRHEYGRSWQVEPGQRDAPLPRRRRGRGDSRWPAPGAGHRGRGRRTADVFLHP